MKKDRQSMEKIILKMTTLLIIVFMGIIILMLMNVRQTKLLVYQYVDDTVKKNIERIDADMVKLQNELLILLKNNSERYSKLEHLRPDTTLNYSEMTGMQSELKIMINRYKVADVIFMYVLDKDVLISNERIIFSTSNDSYLGGRERAMRDTLRKTEEEDWYSGWKYFSDGETGYAYKGYMQNGIFMGYAISLDEIFSEISVDAMGYEVVPYIVDKEGNILTEDIDGEKAGQADKRFLSENRNLSISSKAFSPWIICVSVISSKGSIQSIVLLQILSVISSMLLVPICFLFIWSYQKKILRPMKLFVESISNPEKEQWLHENGKNNLYELEMASEEFRLMLRKIKKLKIDIYEKELEQKENILELMKMQIQPHFYINCLSTIHGMADLGQTKEILWMTEILSDYMRYVLQDGYEKKSLAKEIDFVENYVEIQKIRYNQNAFSYEIIMESDVEEYLIPVLLVHNFVENAIVNGISLDRQVDVTVYITIEKYEDGEYLYICISDTGNGFSEEVLQYIRKGEPIYYNGRKHVGISNSVKRLELMYGEKAKVNFSNMGEKTGAVVEIWIPAEKASIQ